VKHSVKVERMSGRNNSQKVSLFPYTNFLTGFWNCDVESRCSKTDPHVNRPLSRTEVWEEGTARYRYESMESFPSYQLVGRVTVTLCLFSCEATSALFVTKALYYVQNSSEVETVWCDRTELFNCARLKLDDVGAILNHLNAVYGLLTC
jgi:hypothetical protein